MTYINPRRTNAELEEWCICLEHQAYYAREEGRYERGEKLLRLWLAVETELEYRTEND